MGIPHWVGSVVILALIGSFAVFAFRQGMAVKPRGSNTKMWWQAVPPLPPPEDDAAEADNPEQESERQSDPASAHDNQARHKFRPGDIVAVAVVVFAVYSVVTDKWNLSSFSASPYHSNFGPDWDCYSQRGEMCIKSPANKSAN